MTAWMLTLPTSGLPLQDSAHYQCLQEALQDPMLQLYLHGLHVTTCHHYPLGLHHLLSHPVCLGIWDIWGLTVESAFVGPEADSEKVAYKYEPIFEACQHSKELRRQKAPVYAKPLSLWAFVWQNLSMASFILIEMNLSTPFYRWWEVNEESPQNPIAQSLGEEVNMEQRQEERWEGESQAREIKPSLCCIFLVS